MVERVGWSASSGTLFERESRCGPLVRECKHEKQIRLGRLAREGKTSVRGRVGWDVWRDELCVRG